MKIALATSLLLFLGAASALPADLQERADDPPADPIHLPHGPAAGDSFKCGTHTYTGHEIYLAAQYGVNLQLAGQTRGRNQYPRKFPNNDSKGNKLNFPSWCPADDNRREYPLKNGGVYNGGKNNVNQGDERVVYYYEDGEIGADGHPMVYYCGIMTHVGATVGGFLLC